MPKGELTHKYIGVGSKRLKLFTKIYKIVRLSSSIIIIKKFYPVCLERFLSLLISNRNLYKQYLRTVVIALQDLLENLMKYKIEHGNLKPSNCFLKYVDGQLQIMVSDPYLSFMFDDPLSDTESIATTIHMLVSGRPPIQIPDYKRQIHQSVKNCSYYPLIKYYFDLADGLINKNEFKKYKSEKGGLKVHEMFWPIRE
jgi:hypothetical protein